MIHTKLTDIFEGIVAPISQGNTDKPMFAVAPVAPYDRFFLGKDAAGSACLLIETVRDTKTPLSPIRLESLDARFDLDCHTRDAQGQIGSSSFSYVRCRSLEAETIQYFLSVCEIIIQHLGTSPSQNQLADSIRRIASIFQNIRKPPTRSLNGLFGELFFISQSKEPKRAIDGWRTEESARFDFVYDAIRLDVKCSSSRIRTHTFSYDQCNPPPNTHAVVVSLMAERIPTGKSISDLIALIEREVSDNQDCVLRLHEVVASTLGSSLTESLKVTFDLHLTENSMRFFDLRDIPAIRGPVPKMISNIRFDSHLEGLEPLSKGTLIDLDQKFQDLIGTEYGY